MRGMRRVDVAVILVALVVIAGLGYALRPRNVPSAPLSYSAAAEEQTEPGGRPPKTMLFIGDSFVAGTGLDETSYGCMAAVRMQWLCKVSAGPGTGYISGGPANRFELEYLGESQSFAERIPRLGMEYKPDLVVLDGGRNDTFASTDAVYSTMVSTISDVRRTWPSATVVVVRPRLLSQPLSDMGYDDDFFARLQAEEITQNMVVFIDPLARLTDVETYGTIGADGIHPNREGEMLLARVFFDSLVAHGFIPGE